MRDNEKSFLETGKDFFAEIVENGWNVLTISKKRDILLQNLICQTKIAGLVARREELWSDDTPENPVKNRVPKGQDGRFR
jgi:hypothetical protein